MIKKWLSSRRKRMGDYRIFKVDSVVRKSPDSGVEGTFFLVDSPDWMTIIPLVKNDLGEDCFLMVKQYRHGSDSITLEFPAGMVDPGEEAIETAVRELSEETGFKSSDIQKIGSINPNPAFMTNKTTTFLARDLEKIGQQHLDEHEEIECVFVPIKEFDSMVGGEVVNSAITIQSYYFYLRSLSPDIFNLG